LLKGKNMSKEYIATANTVEEATAEALAGLGVGEDQAIIEVLETPGKKLFGGRKDAVVKAVFRENEVIAEATDTPIDDSGDLDSTETIDIAAVEADDNEEELSDEQIDEIADAGIEHLKKLISFISDGGISIEEFEGDEGEIILDVSGEDVGVLIGRHGRTIDALQSIVSAMTTKKTGIRYPLSVDVEGYKHRRKQKVVEIARRAADRARRTNRPVSLKSMSPHERRIVHMSLRGYDGVTSTSEGSGSNRHVVVIPS
jgi:spoIIIJ-associated protein